MKKVLLAISIAFASTSVSAGVLIDAPKAPTNSKSFTEILEKYKHIKEGVIPGSSSSKDEVKKTAVVQTVADTDYDEINVLQNKLQNVESYAADKRDELAKFSCTSATTCQEYYKQLQLEAGWYDALQAGYAKQGCKPNKKKVLLSNAEAIYYQVQDPMLAKDEVKITRTNIRLADLTQNKRVLANADYSDEVCHAYARDIWTSFAQNKLKKLKIKRIEY